MTDGYLTCAAVLSLGILVEKLPAPFLAFLGSLSFDAVFVALGVVTSGDVDCSTGLNAALSVQRVRGRHT